MSSGKTTRAQVPYPLSSDTANVASDIQSIANFIDSNIPLWASTTTGTAPTPSVNSTGGEFWWCSLSTSANYGLNYYNGTSWINLGSNFVYVGTSAPTIPFAGQIWINTTYTNSSVSYYNGSTWVVIVPGTSTSGLIMTSGSAGPQYSSAVAVQGPQGYQGSLGPQGSTGAQGTQGIQGNQGTQGNQGSLGPQGSTGAQGPQGTPGSAYATGATTSVQGAIQLAGDLGGTGTTSTSPQLSSVGTAGTYTKVTTDLKGRVTSGATLSAADIPTALSSTTSVNGTNIPSSATLLTATTGVTTFAGGSTGLTPASATSGAVSLAGTLAVANGGTGVTSSTGSGSNVLSTSPTLTTPTLSGNTVAGTINSTTIPSSSTLLTTTTGQKIASVNVLTSSSSTISADVYNVFSISSITSLTMPATGTNGATTKFFNDSNYNATLATNTGQTFYLYNSIGGTNTVVLTPGATISFVYNSSGSAWYASAMNYGLTPITAGGTNATTATAALTNLGGMATSTYDAAGINQQVIGTTATQTLTNKTIDGALNTIKAPTARIYSASLVTPFSNSASSSVLFDTTSFSTGGFAVVRNAASTIVGLVAPISGYYAVTGNAFYTASNTGNFEVQLWTGTGSGVGLTFSTQYGSFLAPASTVGNSLTVSDVFYVASGNNILLAVRQTSGSTQNTNTGVGKNFLTATLISQ
jgi:hypothetical protein